MKEQTKIAVAADGPSLDAKIANRFGTAEYLLIIDMDSGEFEAVPNIAAHQRGAGVQATVLAVSRGAQCVITGYCSPAIVNQLRSNGIEVLTGMSGTARDAVEHYRGLASSMKPPDTQDRSWTTNIHKEAFIHAVKSAARQFVNLLPVLIGVVFLIGLFNALVSKGLLTSIFSGNVALDTLLGACFGSVFAGNPINSYVIGGELLEYGVSLFAVTAFIVAWVTVGLVQLPAEIAAFGKRFALTRNGVSFVLAIPVAIFTVLIVNMVSRWLS